MSDIKPSRWYYVLAALIFIAGEAIFFSYIFSNLGGISEGLTQVVVPGNSDLNLSETGKYTVFYENESVVNGRIYSTGQDISGLQVEIKNKSTGFKVPLDSPRGSATYSIGGRTGRSILEFDIVQPGFYELSGWYPNGTGPEVVLAVGKGLFDNIMSMVVVGIITFFGSALAALAIIIIVYRKRKDAERQLEEEAAAIRNRR